MSERSKAQTQQSKSSKNKNKGKNPQTQNRYLHYSQNHPREESKGSHSASAKNSQGPSKDTGPQPQVKKEWKPKKGEKEDNDSSELKYLAEEESATITILAQIYILLWKNLRMLMRKKKIFIFMVMTPLLICEMLRYMQDVQRMYLTQGIVDQKIEPIGKMQLCTPAESEDLPCVSVGYSLIGSPEEDRNGKYERIHELMRTVASRNDFEYGVDVKLLTVGNSQELKKYLNEHKNITQYAVLFCADEQWQEKLTMDTMGFGAGNETSPSNASQGVEIDFFMPCKFEQYQQKDLLFYTLMYNISLMPNAFLERLNTPLHKDNNLLALKLSLDNSVLQMKAKENNMEVVPEIELDSQAFPYVPDRLFMNADPASSTGTFYLGLIPLSVFMIVYEEMVREKVFNLRIGLLAIGCSNLAFWVSWIITGFAFSLLMACLMWGFGTYYGFPLYMKTPFYILCAHQFSVSANYVAIAMALTSMVSGQAMAYTLSYSLIILSVITVAGLSESIFIYKIFYNLSMPAFTIYLRNLFELLPCFHFAKLYGDIIRTTCYHLDPETMVWTPGREFEFNDLFIYRRGKLATQDRYEVTPMIDSFRILWSYTLLYIMIAWYFDNVLSSNRGTAKPLLFFLSPSYWFPSLAKKGPKSVKIKDPLLEEGSVDMAALQKSPIMMAKEEKRIVQMLERNDTECNGVRILGISKTYHIFSLRRALCFLCKKKESRSWHKNPKKSHIGHMKIPGHPQDPRSQDNEEKEVEQVEALKNVYLEVQQGELLSIMGHNGAGKTTMMNVIGGLLSNDTGNVRIYESTLNEDQESLRRNLGIVSQFDVLWDELTAYEHMYLFAQVKRINYAQFEKWVYKRLRAVGLQESIHLQVSKFSGGMRRRMSVALSSVGDPRLILMDEPTTGMDPVSRKQVWELIQKLKRKRTVIMTTHAMEEAELLSDKLAVLNHGEVTCVGTPLQLKNSLGKGYRINVVCEKNAVNAVKGYMKTIVPSSEFYETSGESGSLVYNVPLARVKELGSIFRIIDNKRKAAQVTPDEEAEQTTSLHERKALLNMKKLIKDIGVSQTTLEEVFMVATSCAGIQ